MDALTRCLTLAPLLWPDVGCDIVLRAEPSAPAPSRISADVYAIDCGGEGKPFAHATGATGPDALDSLAHLLAHNARNAAHILLRAAGVPAPTRLTADDAPSRDELAARLAEAERELADAVRMRDHWLARFEALGAAVLDVGRGVPARLADVPERFAYTLRLIASRLDACVDPQPPQRAPGVVAGVSADVVDGWREVLDGVSVRGAAVCNYASTPSTGAAGARGDRRHS